LSCGIGDTQLLLDLSRRLARAVAIEAHRSDIRNCRDFAPKRVGELRDATPPGTPRRKQVTARKSPILFKGD
jgi:hypothetical protein